MSCLPSLHWKSITLWHELHWISLPLSLDALTHISTFNTSNLQGGRCQTKCFSYFSLLRERRAWAQICQQSNIWGPVGDEGKQRYRGTYAAYSTHLPNAAVLLFVLEGSFFYSWNARKILQKHELKSMQGSWVSEKMPHRGGVTVQFIDQAYALFVSCVTAILNKNVIDDEWQNVFIDISTKLY